MRRDYEPSCRQVPTDEPSCVGEHFRTRDDSAVFAACFSVRDRYGRAVPHVMRFNAYNRPPAALDSIDRTGLVHRPRFVATFMTRSRGRFHPPCFLFVGAIRWRRQVALSAIRTGTSRAKRPRL